MKQKTNSEYQHLEILAKTQNFPQILDDLTVPPFSTNTLKKHANYLLAKFLVKMSNWKLKVKIKRNQLSKFIIKSLFVCLNKVLMNFLNHEQVQKV